MYTHKRQKRWSQVIVELILEASPKVPMSRSFSPLLSQIAIVQALICFSPLFHQEENIAI